MANGRYDDRLKVYKDNAWHNAKRVRVYKNGWVDLGDDQSSNTKSLYVYKNGNRIRITRDRHDEQKSRTVGAGYHQGSWNITTRQQYCFNNTGGATNTKFYARFNVKAKAGTAVRLFEYRSAYFGDNCKIYAGIRSNGKVWYRLTDYQWSGRYWDHETTAAITMGYDAATWQTIEFIGDVGTNTLYVKVNGVSQGFPRHSAWESNSNNAYVGDSNLRIATNNTFKIDTANSPFTSITEDTTTEYYTETTWV